MDYILRSGNIPKQLRLAVQEVQPEVFVIGRPVKGVKKSVFTPEEFQEFVDDFEQAFNVQIEIVNAEAKSENV